MQPIHSFDFHELPGFSKLYRDYLYHFSAELAAFYPAGNPRDLSLYPARAESLYVRNYSREILVPILKEQNLRWGAGEPVLSNLEKLRDSRTVAIVTGQQVGIFGGPLFTLYKALTAIKLSQQLNQQYGIQSVPVFWMASDDHDFKEALSTNIIDKEGKLLPLEYELSRFTQNIPASEAMFDESIKGLINQLFENLFATEFKGALQQELESCYQPEVSAAESFGKWWMKFLGEWGMIIVNPADARLKQLGLPLFEKEIMNNSPSTQGILKTNPQILAAGYHTQLTLKEDGYNLFLHQPGRASIKKSGDRLVVQGSDDKKSPAVVCGFMRKHPDKVSPNVVLRPLFQDNLFPTLAYIAGPSELAYFAQLSAAYKAFDISMPFIYPRISVTLLENKIQQIMVKNGYALEDILGNVETLITEVLKKTLPDNYDADIKALFHQIEDFSTQLQAQVGTWDPTLVKTVETATHSMQHQLDGLSKKILSAHKKKNDTIRQQIYRAALHLYPNGIYQERILNLVPYLNKYGPAMVRELAETISLDNPHHQVILIGKEKE